MSTQRHLIALETMSSTLPTSYRLEIEEVRRHLIRMHNALVNATNELNARKMALKGIRERITYSQLDNVLQFNGDSIEGREVNEDLFLIDTILGIANPNNREQVVLAFKRQQQESNPDLSLASTTG